MTDVDSHKKLLILYGTTSIILYFVSISFAACSICTVITHQKKQYFVKRRPVLVGATIVSHSMTALFCTHFGCVTPLFQIMNNELLIFVSDTIGWILGTFALVSPTLLLIRFWLLYFDMELSQLLKNQHWQMVINPKKLSNNWFLNPQNQRRYGGSGMFLLVVGLIFCVFQRLCFVILVFTGFYMTAIGFSCGVIIIEAKLCFIHKCLFVIKRCCF